LASPSASNLRTVIDVLFNGWVNDNDYDEAQMAFRPVVCLPSSVVNQ